jgi:hypothetical protein
VEESETFRSVTLTDAEGTFLLCSNPPGAGRDQSMWLTVRKPGFVPSSILVTPWQPDGSTVLVDLTRE